MTILTTGSKSGLGEYLYKELGGAGFDRGSSRHNLTADVIVHCAFNSAKNVTSASLYSYLEDNLFLTKDLTLSPHKKFIFISSIEVYPADGEVHSEEEDIEINSVDNIYAASKLMAEAIVRENCPNYLILRCSALLGKHSRKNNLIKIIQDEKPDLTLSGESEFNYVLHSDVLEFIKKALKEDLQGIYNIASSENITLSEAAGGKEVSFGEYAYATGKVDNSKASALLPSLKKSSKDKIEKFIKYV